jgi:hypothetical protein
VGSNPTLSARTTGRRELRVGEGAANDEDFAQAGLQLAIAWDGLDSERVERRRSTAVLSGGATSGFCAGESLVGSLPRYSKRAWTLILSARQRH